MRGGVHRGWLLGGSWQGVVWWRVTEGYGVMRPPAMGGLLGSIPPLRPEPRTRAHPPPTHHIFMLYNRPPCQSSYT